MLLQLLVLNISCAKGLQDPRHAGDQPAGFNEFQIQMSEGTQGVVPARFPKSASKLINQHL